MVQAPYPPMSELSVDNLAATAKATDEDITRGPFHLELIDSRQRGTLGALPEAVLQPEAVFLHTYVEEGILIYTGPT